jgi:hypothetical protein
MLQSNTARKRMIKSKLLLLTLVGFGVLVCSDTPEEPSTFQRVKNLCKTGFQSPVVPILIAGFGSRVIFEKLEFKKYEGKIVIDLDLTYVAFVNPLFWIAKFVPVVGDYVFNHRKILNKFLAASSGYALTRLMPGLNKKDNLIATASGVAATLGVLL